VFSADVIFVADASKHVTWKEFKRQKQVINDIARLFNVKDAASRGALVTFGERPVINVNFDSYKNLNDFNRLVDSSSLINGTRNIPQTMDTVTQLVKRTRVEVPKVVIFFIKDGESQEFSKFGQYRKRFDDFGAKLFAFGTPLTANYQILEDALVEPSHMMKFVDFEHVLPKGPGIVSHIVSRKYVHLEDFCLFI